MRDTCLCMHTQRAGRALARHFDHAFRPVGLTNQQFSLLMALNQPNSPALGSVAFLLGMDRTTVTAALKPLEARGLVQTQPNPTDRRSRLLCLTDSGAAVLRQAVPIWEREHARVEALLDTGADPLRAALVKLAR